MSTLETPYTRKLFSSRWIFILAAIGSAAGLGNLWRFPYLAYENGGAAFVVAYLICALLLGFPLLILENGLGQITGKAAPAALATVGSKGSFRWIGWVAILNMFTVVTFYMVISGWVISYVTYAPTLKWGNDTINFFIRHIQQSSNIESAGKVVPAVFLGALAVYAMTYFAIRKGTSGIARIALWITPIPFLFLIILAINSLSLQGSSEGLRFFLVPDWSQLLKLKVWFIAVSQAFFSLSIGTATMFALGSLLKRKENVKHSCLFIIFGDLAVSLISGIAIFGVLGYIAQLKGLPVQSVVDSGFGLAFIVLPEALSLLPFGKSIFATLFFVALFTLAFTSIVAQMESILGGLMNIELKIKRSTYLLIISVLALLIGISYMRTNGIYVMDIVTYFLNYSILGTALMQTIIVGWIYNAEKLRTTLNQASNANITPFFDFSLKYFIPVILLTLILHQAINDLTGRYENFSLEYLITYGIGTLVLILIFGVAISHFDHSRKKLSKSITFRD